MADDARINEIIRKRAEAENDPETFVRLGKAGLLDPKVYKDHDSYAQYVAAGRMAALDPGAPLRDLENLVEKYPTIAPDNTVTSLLTGISPDSEFYGDLIKLDTTRTAAAAAKEAAEKAAREKAAAEAAEVDEDEGFQKDDLLDPARFATRWGFAGLSAAWDMGSSAATSGIAELRGWSMGEDVDVDWGNTLMTNDISAAIEVALSSEDVDTGDGWFMGGNVAEKRRELDMGSMVGEAAGGETSTMGREIAALWGLDPDKGAGYVVKAVANVASVAFDPSMYVGAGAVKATGRGLAAGSKELVKHSDDPLSFTSRLKNANAAAKEQHMTRSQIVNRVKETAKAARVAGDLSAELDVIAKTIDESAPAVKDIITKSGLGVEHVDEVHKGIDAEWAPRLQAARDQQDTARSVARAYSRAAGKGDLLAAARVVARNEGVHSLPEAKTLTKWAKVGDDLDAKTRLLDEATAKVAMYEADEAAGVALTRAEKAELKQARKDVGVLTNETAALTHTFKAGRKQAEQVHGRMSRSLENMATKRVAGVENAISEAKGKANDEWAGLLDRFVDAVRTGDESALAVLRNDELTVPMVQRALRESQEAGKAARGKIEPKAEQLTALHASVRAERMANEGMLKYDKRLRLIEGARARVEFLRAHEGMEKSAGVLARKTARAAQLKRNAAKALTVAKKSGNEKRIAAAEERLAKRTEELADLSRQKKTAQKAAQRSRPNAEASAQRIEDIAGEAADQAYKAADEAEELAARNAREAEAARLEILANMLEKQMVQEMSHVENLMNVTRLGVEQWARTNKAADIGDLSTIDSMKSFVDTQLGLMVKPDGGSIYDRDRVMSVLFGKEFNSTFEQLAKMTDKHSINVLSGRGLKGKLLDEVAAAKTADEVHIAMLRGIADDEFAASKGRMKMFHVLNSRLPDGVSRDMAAHEYMKALGWRSKRVKAVDMMQMRVPWGYNLHLNDREAVTDAMYDLTNFVGKRYNPIAGAWRNKGGKDFTGSFSELQATIMNRMHNATTVAERHEAWYQGLDDLHTFAGEFHGASAEAIEMMRKSFQGVKRDARESKSYQADVLARIEVDIAANPGLLPDGFESAKDYLKHLNNAGLEAEMAERVMLPDPRDMQRLFAKVRDLDKAGLHTATDAYASLFDTYWKKSVIAWRGSYIIRNILEGNGRMFLTGHPSILTSVPTMIAMAAGSSEKMPTLKKMMSVMNTGDGDVMGNLFIAGRTLDSADEALMYHQAVDEFGELARSKASGVNPDLTPSQWISDGAIKVTDQKTGEYVEGVARFLQVMRADNLGHHVMRAMLRRPTEAVNAIMRESGLPIEDATVRWVMTTDEGRAAWQNVSGLKGNDGRNLRFTADSIRGFLFGTDAFSLATRIDSHANRDRELLAMLFDSDKFSAKRLDSDLNMDDPFDRTKALAKEIKARHADTLAAESYPVGAVTHMTMARKGREGLLDKYNQFEQKFFWNPAMKVEQNFMRMPEFKFTYWDKAPEMMAALSKADQLQVVEAARLHLNKSSKWSRQRLREIEKIYKSSDEGSGAFTIDDLHKSAMRQAAKHVDELFYDATKRNQMAHAMRFIFPFIQPMTNSIKVWGREMARNSEKVYRATAVAEMLSQPGTEKINEVLTLGMAEEGKDYAAGEGFIYKDEYGNPSIRLPIVGKAMEALAGALTPGDLPQGMTGSHTNLRNWNVVTQNELLPGFGLTVQIPAGLLADTDAYRGTLPDWVQQWIEPVAEGQTTVTGWQGHLPPIAQAFGGYVAAQLGADSFEGLQTRYAGPVMAGLFSANPGDYLNSDGVLDEQGKARLAEDARRVSGGVQVSRWLTNQMLGGAQTPDFFAKTKDRSWVAQQVLSEELREMTDANGGDFGAALNEYIDMYGAQAIMVTQIGNKGGRRASQPGWNFVKDNLDFADKYPELVPFFFPDGAASATYQRWLNDYGMANTKATMEEVFESTNRVRSDYALAKIGADLMAGTIDEDEAKAREDRIKMAFGPHTGAFAINSYDQTHQINRVSEMLAANKQLAASPAGKAAADYIETRNAVIASIETEGENTPLTGTDNAQARADLLMYGDQLAEQSPQFRMLWWKVFKDEVSE